MALGWSAILQRLYELGEVQAAQNETLADFIQNGPSTGRPGFIRDEYRKRCREAANVPGWITNIQPVTGRSFFSACEPYLDDNNWDGPQLEPRPTISGGQCQGTNYDWTATFVNADGTTFPFNRIDPGPITYTVEPGQVDCSMDPQGRPQQPLVVVRANGNSIVANGNYCGFDFPLQSLTATPSPAGAPDDCGDFEPEQPIIPGDNPPPDPGPSPDGDPTDNPTDPYDPIVPIAPYPDPIFGPSPFPNTPDPLTAADLPGDAQGYEGEDPTSFQGPNFPVPNSQGQQEEYIFPDPPEGRIWIGAQINAFSVPAAYGNIPDTSPNKVFPVIIGNAHLVYGPGRGNNRVIKSQLSVLVREHPVQKVTGVRATLRLGITYSIQPISAPDCYPNSCESPQEV